MGATVLAYGYEDKERKALKEVCDRLGVRLRQVTPAEQALPVGAFFGLAPREAQTDGSGAVPGPMLVLGNFTSRQLDGFLSALRTARAGASLKAVLTEYNAGWSGPALYAELVRERAALGR